MDLDTELESVMFLGGVTPKVMCPWEKNDSKMTPENRKFRMVTLHEKRSWPSLIALLSSSRLGPQVWTKICFNIVNFGLIFCNKISWTPKESFQESVMFSQNGVTSHVFQKVGVTPNAARKMS